MDFFARRVYDERRWGAISRGLTVRNLMIVCGFVLFLACAATADAFYVGEIVWVNDPPRYVGWARVESIYPNGNCVVNPGYKSQPNMRPWLVEPPAKLLEPPVEISAKVPRR